MGIGELNYFWIIFLAILAFGYHLLLILLIYRWFTVLTEKVKLELLFSFTTASENRLKESHPLGAGSEENINQLNKYSEGDINDAKPFMDFSTIDDKKLKWEEFQFSFLHRHPHFYDKLMNVYPTLTSTDLKYCSCFYCQLTNQQASLLLDVTQDAVKKAKKRIYKHFELDNIHELSKHLHTIDLQQI